MGNAQSAGHAGDGGRETDPSRRGGDNEVQPAVHNSTDTHASLSSPHPSSTNGTIGRLRERSNPETFTSAMPTTETDQEGGNIQVERDEGRHQRTRLDVQQHRTRLSRIRSRISTDEFLRGLLHHREETTDEEGRVSTQRSRATRPMSFWGRPASNVDDNGVPSGGTSLRRSDTSSVARRRRRSGLFTTSHSTDLINQNAGMPERSVEEIETDSQLDGPGNQVQSSLDARRTRFSRARNSLYLPWAGLFGSSRSRVSAYLPRSPTPHPGQTSGHGDTASLSDSYHSARRDRDNMPHELDAVEPETRHLLSASRITSGMSSIRRFPHGLRSRSTRLIRRGEHPPLSQVLQLAAAAIAAQLSGHGNEHNNDGTRSLGGQAFDGSIQNFVQTLQEAASAQAGEDIDLNATDGDLPPVNFMRVFQFPNDENGVPIGSPSHRRSTRTDSNGNVTTDSDRSVTLVLVGVRSMPNLQDGPGQSGGTPGPSLDTLLSLPFMPPANILRNGSSGALFRRSDTRMRSNQNNAPANFDVSGQHETRRHSPHSPSRSGSTGNAMEQSLPTGGRTTPTPMSESPLGPRPPPSTPADPHSGHITPTQRPTSASANSTPSLPQSDGRRTRGHESASASGSRTATMAANSHQRRRSDTSFARRPDLGSGAARRNGVVEPDRPAGGAGRSWLIYVVGTNVSPDHPAFTMPSLFTDNPSYEDMQMLSTLLGPVKPPVATQDDVNSAGGTYRLIAQDRMLIAVPAGNETLENIAMVAGDRCLICLCDYEAEEQVRQLDACSHIFHRDCIDEWLTTGRNSCPMCRGEGVKEQHPSSTVSPAPEQET